MDSRLQKNKVRLIMIYAIEGAICKGYVTLRFFCSIT